jgi:hypothetical protein
VLTKAKFNSEREESHASNLISQLTRKRFKGEEGIWTLTWHGNVLAQARPHHRLALHVFSQHKKFHSFPFQRLFVLLVCERALVRQHFQFFFFEEILN